MSSPALIKKLEYFMNKLKNSQFEYLEKHSMDDLARKVEEIVDWINSHQSEVKEDSITHSIGKTMIWHSADYKDCDICHREEMQPKHEQHLKFILKDITKRIDTKYRKGQKEHGGDLWTKDCLNEAMDEVVDLLVYLQTELNKNHEQNNE